MCVGRSAALLAANTHHPAGEGTSTPGLAGSCTAQGHAQGHSWQTWILAHHSTVGISCYFLDPYLWSWNFIFPSVFCCCTPEHNLLIVVFPPGRFLEHLRNRCTAVPLCPHAPLFFQSCLQSPWTLLLLTWQSWWMGCWALHSEVKGQGWAGHSCQPSTAGEKREKTSVSRRSCKHVLLGSRIASRSMLPSWIYNADGSLPQRIWKLVWVYI